MRVVDSEEARDCCKTCQDSSTNPSYQAFIMKKPRVIIVFCRTVIVDERPIKDAKSIIIADNDNPPFDRIVSMTLISFDVRVEQKCVCHFFCYLHDKNVACRC